MSFSEQFGPETAGFVEAMALVIASDDVVAEEEMAIVSDAVSNSTHPLFSGLTEIDTTVILEYAKSRALEIVTGSYATVSGDEEAQVKFLALIKQSLMTIAQASSHKDEILEVARTIAAGDGVIAEEEAAMLTCLENCLVSGATKAFQDLFGIAA